VDAQEGWIERSAKAALYAFLLFLAFPLADLLDSPPGSAHLTLVLAGLVAFLAIYLRLMLRPGQQAARWEWLGLATLFAIALALALDNTAAWASLFVYVAAVCGFLLPVPQALLGIAAATALVAITGTVAGYETGETISLATNAAAIGLIALALSLLWRANTELQAAREEIARLAVADERLRFARDLHDLLGHSLSVIALKSQLAGRLLGREPDRAAAEVAEIGQVSREALEEVRDTVTGYRRRTLVDELAGARKALSAAGIQATIERTQVALGPETEAILAWAVREGTTNVIRHSGARRCEIRVRAGLEGAAVEVIDDGGGHDGHDGGGSGLAGLAERASRGNGQVEAGPRPEGGFRLRVIVPTT
jgi:two-component system, NarL family, sensor histidine kinase DesK